MHKWKSTLELAGRWAVAVHSWAFVGDAGATTDLVGECVGGRSVAYDVKIEVEGLKRPSK
jgi:hypothetical protein